MQDAWWIAARDSAAGHGRWVLMNVLGSQKNKLSISQSWNCYKFGMIFANQVEVTQGIYDLETAPVVLEYRSLHRFSCGMIVLMIELRILP